MRLGLIGSTGHWQTYASALKRVPGLTLVAVAAAGPEETTGAFDHAPGLSLETRRYDDAGEMLDRERPDFVDICSWHRLHAEMTIAAAARRYAKSNPDKAAKFVDQAAKFVDKQTKGKYSGQISGAAQKAKSAAGIRHIPGTGSNGYTQGYDRTNNFGQAGGPTIQQPQPGQPYPGTPER